MVALKMKRIKDIFVQKKRRLPLHIGYNCTAFRRRALALDDPGERSSFIRSYLQQIEEVHASCVAKDVPILSFLLLRPTKNALDEPMVQSLTAFFERLAVSSSIAEHQVKISVLGKWYDLPSKLVDAIKLMLEETKGFDRHFLNFCLFYDGQDELVDGMHLLLTKIRHERIEPEVDYASIKEHLSSSYFLPPDLFIIPDDRRRTDGLFLWDSKNTLLFLDERPFEAGKAALEDALAMFQKR
ncbi:MAG: hypothetical protein GXP63_07570 [DPANN group archaeon]|nr:hypothetical protein [DPANN group archaeon]